VNKHLNLLHSIQEYPSLSAPVPEFVVSEGSVSLVVEASVEPAAVLRVDEVSFGGADVRIRWHWPDLGRSVARGCLGRPDANLPPFVEDESRGAAVLEDGVVVLVLLLSMLNCSLRH
jgi:hypothetical protein